MEEGEYQRNTDLHGPWSSETETRSETSAEWKQEIRIQVVGAFKNSEAAGGNMCFPN